MKIDELFGDLIFYINEIVIVIILDCFEDCFIVVLMVNCFVVVVVVICFI